MTSRPHACTAAILAVCVGLALPGAAAASSGSGGSGLGGSGTTTSPSSGSSSTATAQATPVGGPVSAAGNGFTVNTDSVGVDRRALVISGNVAASDSGDALVVQREIANGTWQDVASGRVTSTGSFSVAWKVNAAGTVPLRASLGPPGDSAAAASATENAFSPTLNVTIYQVAKSTIYGPGFYGRRTACGQKLTPGMLGVASRTLKCGTEVAIDFRGRSVTVPVIDRGPFANGASWDLTEATARALGDPGTEMIGTVAVPGSTPTATATPPTTTSSAPSPATTTSPTSATPPAAPSGSASGSDRTSRK